MLVSLGTLGRGIREQHCSSWPQAQAGLPNITHTRVFGCGGCYWGKACISFWFCFFCFVFLALKRQRANIKSADLRFFSLVLFFPRMQAARFPAVLQQKTNVGTLTHLKMVVKSITAVFGWFSGL